MGGPFPLKRTIDLLFHRLGYNITRMRAPEPVSPLNLLNLVVLSELRQDSTFTFIQVGANDGVRSDPLRELIIKYSLHGVLVEPLPDFFAQLAVLYAGLPGLAFECAAVDREAGKRTLYRVRRGAPVPDWAHGLGSFNKRHLMASVREEHIEPVMVETITIGEIARKHGVQSLSLLQVDAEGFDAEIVKMALEEGLVPQIINYENKNLSHQDRVGLKELLLRQGYRFVDYGDDTIAVRGRER